MATAVSAAPARTGATRAANPIVIWHLVSLDAPTVAALWTAFAGRTLDTHLPWTAPAALALAVWMLYVADRILDAARSTAPLEDRHRFHHSHRNIFAAGLLAALPVLAVLLVLLPCHVRTAWMLLAAPLALYVAAVHLLRLRTVPKEHLVAIFFAIATFLPEATTTPGQLPRIAPAAVLFGALCWINCVAIARWENHGHNTGDSLTATAARHLPITVAALAIVTGLRSIYSPQPALPLAIALSAVLLLLLHLTRDCYRPVTLRALADAALLTPLLLWPLASLRA